MTADPYGAENRPQPAKIGDMFTVAVDRVELLRQKLDIVNAQLGGAGGQAESPDRPV